MNQQEREKIKDWDFYLIFNDFRTRDAAYLWCEIVPPNYRDDYPPNQVSMIRKLIEEKADAFPEYKNRNIENRDRNYLKISRSELKIIACDIGKKPKFLFPEMVADSADNNELNIEEKPLNTKKRNSYLKLIKGLLQKQGIDPSERGTAKSLVGIVKDAKQSLEDDAIRGILKEVQDLEEDA
jgi:hypothetical protein